MGTEITLDVGGLTVDRSKNSRGADHGVIFQEKDRQRIRSAQIDYEYFQKNDEDPGSMEMGFSRPLRDAVPRLELLGFTLDQTKREYLNHVEKWREEYLAIREEGEKADPEVMGFEEFCGFATAHPLLVLDDTYDGDASEDQIRGRFVDRKTAGRIPRFVDHDDLAWSERSYFGTLINILHPYSVLRILAENKLNLDAPVVWQYGPLVINGWADEGEFVPCARRTQTFLVAAEGSSDAHILGHAFKLLRPEIEDFFRLIDVSDRHPFPGTGNLLKFAEGLAKIDVHNQVIFLFDNDAEGFDTYQRLSRLKLPPNMQAMMLPTLEQFREFPAQGPGGVSNADINRRAAAIECYLDLTVKGYPPAKVIWTNYKKDVDAYQGALEFKDSYVKEFLHQTTDTVATGSYDVKKLRAVLDAIVSECTAMAVRGMS